MNFEKFIIKYKKNILLFFIIFLAIAFITTPNKVHFLYSTPLGRAYLIALLIIVTTYNRYLGLIAVLLIAAIYNTTDTITENMENATTETTEKKDTEEKSFFSSALGAVGLQVAPTEEKKEEAPTAEAKAALEDSMRPKEAFSLMSIPNIFNFKKQPIANWSGKNAYGLPFAPIQ